MNTREKIDRATDPSRLCLYKEGIFYKLYKQHAMLFTDNIKGLKVKANFVKAAGQYKSIITWFLFVLTVFSGCESSWAQLVIHPQTAVDVDIMAVS